MSCFHLRWFVGLLAIGALVGCSSDADDAPSTPSADVASGDADGVTDAADVVADTEGSGSVTGVQADGSIRFGLPGSTSTESGLGSFRFGAATASAQIEDQNTASDWYAWTLPVEEGGLGNGEFVGDAVQGFTRAVEDVSLLTATHLDSYRFHISWSRVEPARDEVDEAAVAHYGALLDALVAAEIQPMVTLFHFSNPLWTNDFVDGDCTDGPTDEHLCGWSHPEGAAAIIEELAEHAGRMAAEYGDRVDDWCTINEPVNYLVASYGIGYFPPGERLLLTDFSLLIETMRNFLRAHVAMAEAIRAADTVDADGDGVAASVGLTLSIADWVPARRNAPSTDPEDVAAAAKMRYLYHEVVPQALLEGGLDTDFDGEVDEEHPEWMGSLDWLGVQYYFRTGVTGERAVTPELGLAFCFEPFDFGSCLPPGDATFEVPSMNYEFWAEGWYTILVELGARFPGLPMTVTEGGIATKVGARRAENIVRTLEQIQRAMDDGVDVRGYYHWSLMDNFEWAEGYEPQFGLFSVDRTTYERSPTMGQTVYAEIARERVVTAAHRSTYGGDGPMTPESE